MSQLVKNLPAMRETWVQSLFWEDPLEKGMATHSSILAWRIPWTVPKSAWGHKESGTTEPTNTNISFNSYVRDLTCFILSLSVLVFMEYCYNFEH